MGHCDPQGFRLDYRALDLAEQGAGGPKSCDLAESLGLISGGSNRAVSQPRPRWVARSVSQITGQTMKILPHQPNSSERCTSAHLGTTAGGRPTGDTL
jgi:hypothetical protein